MIRTFACCRFLLSVWLLTAAAAQSWAQSSPNPTIVDATIGFQGVYKLGCWVPLTVEIQGGAQPFTGMLVVNLPDTDGVPTRTFSERSRPVGIVPHQTTTVRMFVRVGQRSSALSAQFISDDGKVRAKRKFYAGPDKEIGIVTGGVPATNQVLLEFGPALGLGELVQAQGSPDEQLKTRIARVARADDLPTRWYGYESVETVLLTTSDAELYRPLLQNRQRVAALQEWVERGGKLVIFCGSNAEELLANNGALASLVPGKFEKIQSLTQPQPLMTFSGSDQPITRNRRINLNVPSLVDAQGQILASAGRSATTVPLVIRSSRGLGEVTFVGLDFDRPPLNDWPGRTSFLRRVLAWDKEKQKEQTTENYEVQDLSGHLRNSLDKKFVGVQTVPFGLVAFLVCLYILLIGPGDYLFVKRVLRRTELTWLTFPLIVIGVSVAAYAIANAMKGDQLLVNQVEVIDVDCSAADSASSLARGTVWTHFFTPQVSEYNVDLQPSYLGQTELNESQQVVSWLGLPGYALGGMQASGSQTSVFDAGYFYGDQLASMQRLPVQVWSTKTLTGRWTAQVEVPLEVELTQDGEELLRGQVTNGTDIELEDCLLLYGRWAYNLGRLPPGRMVGVNASLKPRTVKTMLTSATAGDEPTTNTADDGTVPFQAAQWDMARLVKAMMFHQAVGGQRYTGQFHRYQSFVDLSAQLDYDDQAILLAKCTVPGTDWIANGQPLAGKQDRRWTYYRFLLKVERQETSE